MKVSPKNLLKIGLISLLIGIILLAVAADENNKGVSKDDPKNKCKYAFGSIFVVIGLLALLFPFILMALFFPMLFK
jgi:hypothetical protein